MTELERKAQEFDKEHEGSDGHVTTEHWTIFSDGARRSFTTWGPVGYQLIEPEPGSAEQRKWQIEFWTIKLESLVNEFEQKRQSAQNAGSGHHRQKLAELKELQTAVRSARGHLTRLSIQQRGYTASDVQRCWEVWNELSQALSEESHAQQKFDSALLGKSSAGQLEKLKAKLDAAKKVTARRVEKWNGFQPEQARDIVAEQLDQEARAERERELEEIEV